MGAADGHEPGEFETPEVTRGRFPLDGWREGTAKQAVAEATLVQEAMRLPGWGIVAAAIEAAQTNPRRDLRQARTVDGVAVAQAQLAGCRLAESLAMSLLRSGAEAQAALKSGTLRKATDRSVVGDEGALRAKQRAGHVRELLEHPGWRVFERHLLAVADAAVRLKEHCPADTVPILDAMVRALEAPLAKLEQELSFGLGAEQWIAAHRERQE